MYTYVYACIHRYFVQNNLIITFAQNLIMSQPFFPELFQSSGHRFRRHLQTPGNDRIVFSGQYGIGKTSFLATFFHGDNQSEMFSNRKHYTVYRLSPVNYSISATEDIIDYIKYDILLEFLTQHKDFQTGNLDFLETLPLFLKKNLDKVAATLI